LETIDEVIHKREANYFILASVYANPDFIPMETEHLTTVSNFAFPLLCQSPSVRDHYLGKADAASIETRPIVGGNITAQVFWRKYVPEVVALPGADHVQTCGFYVGNNPELTQRELATIVGTFQGVYGD
jgi:CDP-6-deoxy-D-xylo-4-hexulose-3-dehydrase